MRHVATYIPAADGGRGRNECSSHHGDIPATHCQRPQAIERAVFVCFLSSEGLHDQLSVPHVLGAESLSFFYCYRTCDIITPNELSIHPTTSPASCAPTTPTTKRVRIFRESICQISSHVLVARSGQKRLLVLPQACPGRRIAHNPLPKNGYAR